MCQFTDEFATRECICGIRVKSAKLSFSKQSLEEGTASHFAKKKWRNEFQFDSDLIYASLKTV